MFVEDLVNKSIVISNLGRAVLTDDAPKPYRTQVNFREGQSAETRNHIGHETINREFSNFTVNRTRNIYLLVPLDDH